MRVKMSPGLVARSSLGPRFHLSSAGHVDGQNSAVEKGEGRGGTRTTGLKILDYNMGTLRKSSDESI
jgi:hypothetical protein